mmetsp:Transcript_50164/g.130236  ORF Transcript_50164/g.130236 Transcript_50164/m.130236 type:complete len:263 (+) Transcript_50164:742-1530(+)
MPWLPGGLLRPRLRDVLREPAPQPPRAPRPAPRGRRWHGEAAAAPRGDPGGHRGALGAGLGGQAHCAPHAAGGRRLEPRRTRIHGTDQGLLQHLCRRAWRTRPPRARLWCAGSLGGGVPARCAGAPGVPRPSRGEQRLGRADHGDAVRGLGGGEPAPGREGPQVAGFLRPGLAGRGVLPGKGCGRARVGPRPPRWRQRPRDSGSGVRALLPLRLNVGFKGAAGRRSSRKSPIATSRGAGWSWILRGAGFSSTGAVEHPRAAS